MPDLTTLAPCLQYPRVRRTHHYQTSHGICTNHPATSPKQPKCVKMDLQKSLENNQVQIHLERPPSSDLENTQVPRISQKQCFGNNADIRLGSKWWHTDRHWVQQVHTNKTSQRQHTDAVKNKKNQNFTLNDPVPDSSACQMYSRMMHKYALWGVTSELRPARQHATPRQP